MEFTINLTWQDYMEANLLLSNSKKSVRWIIIFIVVITTIIGIREIVKTGEFNSIIVFPIVFIPAFYLERKIFFPKRVKKIYQQQKSLQVPTTVIISENEIKLNNELGNEVIPWTNFIKWMENDKVLLLFHSDIVFNFFPKRDIPDEETLNTIKKYLAENNVPRK